MAKPGTGFITTGDGVKIAYEYLPCKRSAPTVVLIHGKVKTREITHPPS